MEAPRRTRTSRRPDGARIAINKTSISFGAVASPITPSHPPLSSGRAYEAPTEAAAAAGGRKKPATNKWKS